MYLLQTFMYLCTGQQFLGIIKSLLIKVYKVHVRVANATGYINLLIGAHRLGARLRTCLIKIFIFKIIYLLFYRSFV